MKMFDLIIVIIVIIVFEDSIQHKPFQERDLATKLSTKTNK